jgi:hypothetical protein
MTPRPLPGRADERARAPEHPSRQRMRPTVLAAGPGLASLLVIVVSSLVLADRLPTRVPSRWGSDGVVETLPLWGLTALLAAVSVLLTVLLSLIAERIGPPSAQRWLGGLSIGLPAAVAALHVGVLLAAADAGPTARLPVLAGGVALLVAVAGTLGGALLVRPVERATVLIEPRRIEVAPGEAVVWTGRTSAPTWLWMTLTVVALLAGALLVPVLPVVGVIVVMALLLAVTALTARVAVGPAGLSVRLGPAGLFGLHVPLADMTTVDAIVVEPLAHGGWGIRLLPGLRAVVFRHGPGIRVMTADGQATIVTIDGAAQAAGVLRAHLDRHATKH